MEPSAPRGYNPTPQAGGPVLRRALLMPVGTPYYTCTQSVLNSLAPGPVGREGHRVGWSRPRCQVPPQAGPARRAVTGRRPDRLGRSPGRLVHTYVSVSARERKKEEGRTAGETGGARQREGQWCARVAGAGLKIEGASDGLQESSMAQLRGETNQEY